MMILYVCKECGRWSDMAIADAVSKALDGFTARFIRAFTPNAEPLEPFQPHAIAPECPDGHGPMQYVPLEHRLMSWNPEMNALYPLQKIAINLSDEDEPHDGNLDTQEGDHHAIVMWQKSYFRRDDTVVSLSGGYGDCEAMQIYLDASQALSLLTWLEQEKPTLERLIGEEHA